jgi:hypothetical protein
MDNCEYIFELSFPVISLLTTVAVKNKNKQRNTQTKGEALLALRKDIIWDSRTTNNQKETK